MVSSVESLLQQRIIDFDNMDRKEQRQKLEQILLVYANGDPLLVEGMKLTFHAIVSHNRSKSSRHQKYRSLINN